MYRIRVASDSAGTLSSSSLLLEFIWSVSEIQQPIEKFSKVALERNWTRDNLFTGVSPPKSCYSQWKHRCFFFFSFQSLLFDFEGIFSGFIISYFTTNLFCIFSFFYKYYLLFLLFSNIDKKIMWKIIYINYVLYTKSV